MGGKVEGLNLPIRDFPCKTPEEVRATLPKNTDVVAFQCRNPVHRAHYELFTRALDAPNVDKEAGGVVLVHPTCVPHKKMTFLVLSVTRLMRFSKRKLTT